MKILGAILALPAGAIAWYAISLAFRMILSICFGTDSAVTSNVSAMFFVFIGPIVGIAAIPATYRYFCTLADEEERRSREERDLIERRNQEAQRHHEETEKRKAQNIEIQAELRASLERLVSESFRIANGLAGLVDRANRSLDLAKDEFAEGAFVPFWEAIEAAAKSLATYDLNTQQLTANAQKYSALVLKLAEHKAPSFTLSVQTLPNASIVAQRLGQIVRPAQRSPDFDKIYLMMKNNDLLVRGFSSLGQAINDLGDRIEQSNDRLSSVISDLASSQADMLFELEKSREHLEDESESRRDHEKQQLEMLDNLQRRRMP